MSLNSEVNTVLIRVKKIPNTALTTACFPKSLPKLLLIYFTLSVYCDGLGYVIHVPIFLTGGPAKPHKVIKKNPALPKAGTAEGEASGRDAKVICYS